MVRRSNPDRPLLGGFILVIARQSTPTQWRAPRGPERDGRVRYLTACVRNERQVVETNISASIVEGPWRRRAAAQVPALVDTVALLTPDHEGHMAERGRLYASRSIRQ